MNEPGATGGAAVLAGIRVLDFGRYVAGPYCATLLGYLGADVIRIEKTTGGEDRYLAPIAGDGSGAVFFQTACNKRSLALNLASPGARPVIGRLVRSADVVVVNLPDRALARYGLDYASLCALKPDIILASQSTFGHAGPYRDRGGFDGIGQAMSGAMYMTGVPGSPIKAAAPYVDFSTAVLSAAGVLAALLHRRQTGEGQEIRTSLLGTALSVFASHLAEQGATGRDRVGTGNTVQTSAPSDVFATRDGHVLTHVIGNELFERWAGLVGGADRWTSDPRFRSDAARGDHREPILHAMRAWCADRTTQQAVDALVAAGIPCGPVQTLQQALDDPQVAAMAFLKEIADYPGLRRPVPVPDLPIGFSRTPGGITRRPPRLAEHTRDVLEELHFDPEHIARLIEEGVVT